MKTIKQIYLYKGWAYLKEVGDGETNYYSMPDDFSSFWQQRKKEDYEQAKYYGMPARKNIIPRKERREMAV
jgi:hypothetical protein